MEAVKIRVGMEQFRFFDAVPQAIFVLDSDYRIRYWNETAERWTGYSREELLGDDARGLFEPLGQPGIESRLDLLFRQGVPVIFSSHVHPHIIPARLPNGKRIIQQTTVNPISLDGVEHFHALVTIQNMTELQERTQVQFSTLKKLRTTISEKELLIREIHHRVKNNLSLVSSMISLQIDSLPELEREKLSIPLGELKSKIDSLSLLHKRLYQGNNLSHIEGKEYLEELIHNIIDANGATLRIDIEKQIEPCMIPNDTSIYLGLILTELMTNVVKHAFPDRREGAVYIEFSFRTGPAGEDDGARLIVADDGKGFPEGLRPDESESFGMVVINTLVAQMGGDIHCGNAPADPVYSGSRVEISLPLVRGGTGKVA